MPALKQFVMVQQRDEAAAEENRTVTPHPPDMKDDEKLALVGL